MTTNLSSLVSPSGGVVPSTNSGVFGPGQTAEYSMNIHDDPALGKKLLLSAKNGFQSQFNQKMAGRKAPD